LPIFVGHFEVEAIRLKLMDVDVQRPMTHDLLGAVIGNLGGSVDRIVVSELKNDTFYAKILVEYNGQPLRLILDPVMPSRLRLEPMLLYLQRRMWWNRLV